nr:hypothetical protein [Tanacetum cinerariifolium]
MISWLLVEILKWRRLWNGLESKEMKECYFVVERDAWLRGEFTLSSLDGLDMSLLGDVIGEDDCDDDG